MERGVHRADFALARGEGGVDKAGRGLSIGESPMPIALLALPLLLAAQAAPPPAAPPPPPPACTAPENRQFDFWVGSWDVYPTGGTNLVAHSLIERRYSGCAIRENWMPLHGEGGGSFSAWRPEAGHWRQTWVDSRGGWVEFSGGMASATLANTATATENAVVDRLEDMGLDAIRSRVRECAARSETAFVNGTRWNPDSRTSMSIDAGMRRCSSPARRVAHSH